MVKTIEGLVEEISTLLDRGEVEIPEYKSNPLKSGEDRVTNKRYSLDSFSRNPSSCFTCRDCYTDGCYTGGCY